MKEQSALTEIKRTLATDLLLDKNPNGYVKVCSTWLKRMWGAAKDESSKDGLNRFTTQFDECGAFDSDGNVIEKGGEYEMWSNALDFLEWFGIQKMEGFGVIIINTDLDSTG